MFHHALRRAVAVLALFTLIVATAASLSAQPAADTKKPLTFKEYDIWRVSAGVVLSRDGQYVAYLMSADGKDGEAVIRHVASGKEHRFARGPLTPLNLAIGPRFTPDHKRVLLPLTPTRAELEKAKANKVKADDFPKPSLAIVDLATGTELERIANAGSFQLGGEGAGFIIYRKGATPEPGKTGTPGKTFGKGKGAAPTSGDDAPPKTGTDLYIRDLSGTVERTIPEVTEYNLSNDEQTLVFIVAGKNEAKNGVYTLNPRFNTAPVPVKTGAGRYSRLTWNESQAKLAFFYDDSQVPPLNLAPPPRVAGSTQPAPAPATPAQAAPPQWRVFVWERGAKSEPAPVTRIPIGSIGPNFAVLLPFVLEAPAPATAPLSEVFGPDTPGLKEGWSINATALSFSQDGSKLYVSTAPVRPAATPTPTDDIQLDIWHWKDAALQPMQKLRANADRNKTYGAVVLLDTKELRHLSDDSISVQSPGVGDWAIATDDSKYRHATGYAYPVPTDYALLNVRTGEKKPLLNCCTYGIGLSPDGKYLLGFDGIDWFTLTVPEGKRVNLTGKLKVKFHNEDHDLPAEPPAYASALWTSDGKFVLVRDRYDIWKIAADGSSIENLTKIGREQGIRFTLLNPRSAENRTVERQVDITKPLLLGAQNISTRDTGFYRLEPGRAPKLLIMGARNYGNPVKAHEADVFLLTVQTFSQYPDFYVTTPEFHELKRVTDINPHIKEYNWGTAELIKYTSSDGDKLSAILIKPEDFDPNKKYPMIVYIYERLSEGLHQFRLPNVTRGQVINPTFYASNGYLVLMPDISYKIGAPGPSSLKCVLPAIQTVVDKGFVDEDAIGINGQSWGGYQIAYMITQTNRFKAAVAGAPVSNMFSAYGGIRWGSGLPRQFQYEKSQSRIGATPWEAPLKYMENSPIFMADRVETPLLMIHNDQDDAVPWYQGIEYYLALRRLGKEVYLLNYNGQPHNLTNKNAARDFAMRMYQFYEHHLRGQPAPEWMEKGVPFIDRESEKELWKKLYRTEK